MPEMKRRLLHVRWPRWVSGRGTGSARLAAPVATASPPTLSLNSDADPTLPFTRAAAPRNAEDRFDDFMRSVASQATRRDALRVSANGAFLSFMTTLGLRPAHAGADCLCGRQLYDPAIQCCTPTGVQTKNPIADLARCPDRVDSPSYTCVANGCGAEGGTALPDHYGAASWLQCCNSHDCCWGRCRSDRNACDTTFRDCIRSSCDAAYPPSLVPLPGGIGTYDENRITRGLCRVRASAGFAAVQSVWGTDAYNAAQQDACDCCGNQACPTCPGGTCSSLPSCQDPGCVCFQTVEGRGFCHLPQLCADLAICTSSSSCPSGWACVAVTCCSGSGPICIQPCFTINGGLTQRMASPAAELSGPMTAPLTGSPAKR